MECDLDGRSKLDYYPFGMQMPGRKYGQANSGYRYGFNGKENDNEAKGEGNQQDYGMRIYDPRAGRFLSVDPICQSYPWYTPYQFAGNTPIEAVDLDGLEEYIVTNYYRNNKLRERRIFAVTDKETGNPINLKIVDGNNERITSQKVLVASIYLGKSTRALKSDIVFKDGLSPEENKLYNNAPKYKAIDCNGEEPCTYRSFDNLPAEYSSTAELFKERIYEKENSQEYNAIKEGTFRLKQPIPLWIGSTDIVGGFKNGSINWGGFGMPKNFVELPGKIKDDGTVKGVTIKITYGIDLRNYSSQELSILKKGVENYANEIKNYLLKSGVKNITVDPVVLKQVDTYSNPTNEQAAENNSRIKNASSTEILIKK